MITASSIDNRIWISYGIGTGVVLDNRLFSNKFVSESEIGSFLKALVYLYLILTASKT